MRELASIAGAGPHRFWFRVVDSNLVALGELRDVLLSLGLIREPAPQFLPGLNPPGQPPPLLHILLLLGGCPRQILLRRLES